MSTPPPSSPSAAETSSASDATVEVAPLSRWSNLYDDALHSVLKFASLADLGRVLSVSRRWSDAVMTMPPIHAETSIGGPNDLTPDNPVAQSAFDARVCGRLARHIWSLGDCWIPSVRHLQSMADHMTSLRSLQWRPNADSEICAPMFSRIASLRVLDVDLSFALRSKVNSWIFVIGGLARLESLTLRLPLVSANVSFAPLTYLPALRKFRLLNSRTRVSSISDAQIAALRSMSSVRNFQHSWFGREQSDLLVRMLQPGHALRWASLQWVYLNEAVAPLIGSLPSLTSLSMHTHCSDVRFFAQLAQLTDLTFFAESPVDATELAAALSHCTRLRTLNLSNMSLTCDQLAQLLPSFPQLTDLLCQGFPALASLSCFDTAALSASLTRLHLSQMSLCPPTEVSHLLNLRSLHGVTFIDWASPHDQDQRALFAVPSARFPQLTESIYSFDSEE